MNIHRAGRTVGVGGTNCGELDRGHCLKMEEEDNDDDDDDDDDDKEANAPHS